MSHEPETTPAPRAPNRIAGGAARFRRQLFSALGVTAVVIVASTSSAFAAGATVTAATSSNFGTVLANAQGFALYALPTDQNGMSSCTGPCVPVWPAVTVPTGTTPTAGAGVTGTVAEVLQSNGTYQVTYNGSPLYTFVGDTSPGEVSGNNVGGFTVVKLAAAPPASSTPPTSAPPPAATTTPTTAPPASSTPTTVASGGTPGSTPAPTVAPVVAPATASGSSASAGDSVPASSASATPTALAATGPGPGLLWMVIVGAGLIAISVSMLLALGGSLRVARATLGRAARAGSWLLGR